MIFRPVRRYHGGLLPLTYAYIEPLQASLSPGGIPYALDKAIGMVRVKCQFRPNRSREGRIIRLTDILEPTELIPVFGKKCPPHWASNNAAELAKEFYVNIFFTKQFYADYA